MAETIRGSIRLHRRDSLEAWRVQDVSRDQIRFAELARQIGSLFFGVEPRVSALPSKKNFVFRLRFDQHVPDRVIKIGREPSCANLRREQAVMRAIGSRPDRMEVPEVEHTQEEYEDDPVPFTIMPVLAGSRLDEFMPIDEGKLGTAYRRAGEFLSRLARLRHEDAPEAHDAIHVKAWTLDGFSDRRAKLHQSHKLPSELEDVLDRDGVLIEKGPTGFAHRDFNAGQVVVDEDGGFGVIDWEDAGFGYPLLDCADFVKLAREQDCPEEYVALFLEGYRAGRNWDAAVDEEYHLWQVYSCLGAVEHHLGQAERMTSLALQYASRRV
jgi:Ser/Thr protein kinase RdoA (MazF antagonist)